MASSDLLLLPTHESRLSTEYTIKMRSTGMMKTGSFAFNESAMLTDPGLRASGTTHCLEDIIIELWSPSGFLLLHEAESQRDGCLLLEEVF